MKGFLDRIVSSALGVGEKLLPRVPSMFEPQGLSEPKFPSDVMEEPIHEGVGETNLAETHSVLPTRIPRRNDGAQEDVPLDSQEIFYAQEKGQEDHGLRLAPQARARLQNENPLSQVGSTDNSASALNASSNEIEQHFSQPPPPHFQNMNVMEVMSPTMNTSRATFKRSNSNDLIAEETRSQRTFFSLPSHSQITTQEPTSVIPQSSIPNPQNVGRTAQPNPVDQNTKIEAPGDRSLASANMVSEQRSEDKVQGKRSVKGPDAPREKWGRSEHRQGSPMPSESSHKSHQALAKELQSIRARLGNMKHALPVSPSPPEPSVHVSIGRVEVKAVSGKPLPGKVGRQKESVMPLQEYLAFRAQGKIG